MSIFTEKILVASEHLQSTLTDLAFHQGYDVEYPSISPGRSSLDAVEVENSGGGGYSGNFTVIAEPEYNESGAVVAFVVKCVDGKSYNKSKNTCKEQLAVVNGERFALPLWQKRISQTGTIYIRLKYTPKGAETTERGQSASSSSVVIESDNVTGASSNWFENDNEDNAFYYIATCYVNISKNTIEISQYHMQGAAIFYHVLVCSDKELEKYG